MLQMAAVENGHVLHNMNMYILYLMELHGIPNVVEIRKFIDKCVEIYK